MDHVGRITGVVGQIKWSYFEAARLEGYTVIRNEKHEWSMSARVVLADAFKLSQRPLLFVAPHAKGEWRWPIVEITHANGRITATLGQPLP